MSIVTGLFSLFASVLPVANTAAVPLLVIGSDQEYCVEELEFLKANSATQPDEAYSAAEAVAKAAHKRDGSLLYFDWFGQKKAEIVYLENCSSVKSKHFAYTHSFISNSVFINRINLSERSTRVLRSGSGANFEDLGWLFAQQNKYFPNECLVKFDFGPQKDILISSLVQELMAAKAEIAFPILFASFEGRRIYILFYENCENRIALAETILAVVSIIRNDKDILSAKIAADNDEDILDRLFHIHRQK